MHDASRAVNVVASLLDDKQRRKFDEENHELQERLRNLRRKDMAFIAAGLSVLMLAPVAEHFHGALSFALHALQGPAVWLAAAGVWTAWYITLKNPAFAANMQQRFNGLYKLLINKYYADDFNEVVFAGGARGVGQLLWKIGDVLIIDGLIVNGSAKVVGWTASVVRKMQTGHLYTYAFSMIIGLLLMISWFVFMSPGAAQ